MKLAILVGLVCKVLLRGQMRVVRQTWNKRHRACGMHNRSLADRREGGLWRTSSGVDMNNTSPRPRLPMTYAHHHEFSTESFNIPATYPARVLSKDTRMSCNAHTPACLSSRSPDNSDPLQKRSFLSKDRSDEYPSHTHTYLNCVLFWFMVQGTTIIPLIKVPAFVVSDHKREATVKMERNDGAALQA